MTPNSATNKRVVFDLGCKVRINSVTLKNTHNAQYNDRGTKDFRLAVSNDNQAWATIVEDVLTDPSNLGCDVQKETFDMGYVQARYLEFTVINFYGNGGGLQYMHIDIVDSTYVQL